MGGGRIARRPPAARALALALALGGAPGVSASAAAAGLSEADRREVARVEAYLDGVRSIRASFAQVASTGRSAAGRLHLRRPRRLRIDYLPPETLQIHADGFWLVYVDTELGEATHVPLSSTPAHLLVGDRVRLSGDVAVTRVERGAGALRLHVVRRDEPEAGRVVLAFADRPLALRAWTVVDAQGVETRVTLIDPEFNAPIADEVFAFELPETGRPDP